MLYARIVLCAFDARKRRWSALSSEARLRVGVVLDPSSHAPLVAHLPLRNTTSPALGVWIRCVVYLGLQTPSKTPRETPSTDGNVSGRCAPDPIPPSACKPKKNARSPLTLPLSTNIYISLSHSPGGPSARPAYVALVIAPRAQGPNSRGARGGPEFK